MDDDRLLGLVLLCIPLSLLSFGGGQSIVVGLQHQIVDTNGWLTADQFTDLFAISKAAPGPGTLIVALIGWQIAGIWGALAASVAIFLPSSLLTGIVGGWWESHQRSRLTIAIERGLLPIAVGLIFAGSLTIAQFANLSLVNIATIAAAGVTLWFTRIGPYPILASVVMVYLGLSFIGL